MQGENDFIDYVKLRVEAGDGGAGVVRWRREKFVPRGGPDGGDGGDGGSVWIEGDPQKWTLLDIKYRRIIRAPDGEAGRGQCQRGASGEDIVLRVPLGTGAWDDDTGSFIGEVLKPGQRVLLARGGRGGRGNHAFRSPTLRAPDFAEPGEPGEKRFIRLELKLLADVCLVGPPNAGKSTLLSVLTRARPKIAPYPFTTLVPQLGVVQDERMRSFVIADLPGLIEGAAEGRGLGHRFLRHVERGAILLFTLPMDHPDPQGLFHALRVELQKYHPALIEKPYLIAFTKCDLVPAAERAKYLLPSHFGPQYFVSGVTHEGLSDLLSALRSAVELHRGPQKVSSPFIP
ncbi:MAG: GTPase ObgE [Bacteroidia bacterium]|nr:GTPase ObgE [Bacteroidia bacterium]MCX7653043.1 GTPase ObgE [Bacteroidia bacterium]MDW8416181.1 GTPase ObgE [Bacteroidia bacterium]